jgi:rare lipoprotein A
MAHKTMPFGTLFEVTHPMYGKSVMLRVNDRGPMQADRAGDVCRAAVRRLGMLESGVIGAEAIVLGMAKGKRR